MLFPSLVSWRRISTSQDPFLKDGLLHIPSVVFRELAFEAFHDVSFLLRASHLSALRGIFDAPDASANEKFVALELLKNAAVAAGGRLPLCQDTGTAVVFAEKGHAVITDGLETDELENGIKKAYETFNLRYSQNTPASLFEETNTKTNLPAQIELNAVRGDTFNFLFVAKGGGSANKTFLFQENRALLNEGALFDFLGEKIKSLGVSACPPYRLTVVIGGLSAEMNLKTVKLGSACALDEMPRSTIGYRDVEAEDKLLEIAKESGIGAQFGGQHFCLGARVFRLARHGASLPVGIGVSCCADRNILARISSEGVFLEQLETDPAKYLPDVKTSALSQESVRIDLDRPISETLKVLSGLKIGTRLSLNGTLIVARDIAHARFRELLQRGKPLPDYLKKHPVFYAGPAKKPEEFACGSLGPTTAGRMDSYTELLQKNGASLIMLAKGNRSKDVVKACQKYGGFYLGAVGGAAAQTSAEHITSCECIDYPDLGMEAVWKISVKDFPAFIIIDDKGNDFYSRF